MSREVYDVRKNENIEENVECLVISKYSPLCDNLGDFNYIENLFVIDDNETWDNDTCFENVGNIFVVPINYSDTAVDYGVVRNHFSKIDIGQDKLVYIDATNLALQIYSYIYAYLVDFVGCSKVWFIYHEAKRYKNPEDYNCHCGNISTVQLECFRETDVNKQELIIYFIGFEGMLTEAIDRVKEPGKKIIINGFPSYLLSYKDVSILNNTHLFVNSYDVDYCIASNPFQTYNKLHSIYKKYNGEYKITIAPCGSTPSSIGAVMFASRIEDVNVIAPRAESYNYESRIYENRWVYCC